MVGTAIKQWDTTVLQNNPNPSVYSVSPERIRTQQNHFYTTWRFCYYKFQNKKTDEFPHNIYNLQSTILTQVCQLEVTAVFRLQGLT